MKLYTLLEDTVKHSRVQSVEGLVYRLSLPGGTLDYDREDEQFILMIIEVDPLSRNQKIATRLLQEFLSIVDKNHGYLSTTTYLDDGEKFIKHVIKRLKPEYPNITWDDDAFDF